MVVVVVVVVVVSGEWGGNEQRADVWGENVLPRGTALQPDVQHGTGCWAGR